MKNNKMLALALASTMSLSLLLTACGGTATPAPATDETPAVETAGTFDLAVSLASEPDSIDPALNTSMDGGIMLQHTHQGLMTWVDSGVEMSAGMNKAELALGQAESVEKVTNEDGTVTYTFKIRDDAKWSDGVSVTAEDFVYSWQRLASPTTASDYGYMIDMVVGFSEVNNGEADPSTMAMYATENNEFVVTITGDLAYFEEVCAFASTFPVRQDIIEAYGDAWTTVDNASHFIGNGPWALTEWVHDSYIKMVPNEYYYGVDSLVPDSLTFQLMADQNAMLAGFKSNSLQFIGDAPVDEIASLLVDGSLNIVDYVGTYYVCYNNEKAPFDNALVRQAFTLAIDSQYIVDQIAQGGQVPATGYVPAGIYDVDATGDDFRTTGGDYWTAPTTAEVYEANCELARELLAEAGYPNGEGFPVDIVYLYNTNDNHKAIGEALQNMWKTELGVTVDIQNQEWNSFLNSRKNGEYDIARNGWIADYNDPCTFLDMWYTDGGNNDAQYSNPEFDALIDLAKSTDDQAVRMQAFHDAEDILIGQDWAIAPIYYYTNMYMMSDALEGAFYTPLGYYMFHSVTQK